MNEWSDRIPLFKLKEYNEVIAELDSATNFPISSDRTVDVADALAVVRSLVVVAAFT